MHDVTHPGSPLYIVIQIQLYDISMVQLTNELYRFALSCIECTVLSRLLYSLTSKRTIY